MRYRISFYTTILHMTNYQFEYQAQNGKHTVVAQAKTVVSNGREHQTKLAIIGHLLLSR